MTASGLKITPLRATLRYAIYALAMPLVLFLSAGRWDWPMAWIYVGLLYASNLVSRSVLLHRHPDLAQERASAGSAPGVPAWDKRLMPLIALAGPVLTWLAAGMDKRFGWSPLTPAVVQVGTLALAILGLVLSTWAMAANRFFSSYVRIQGERGHQVVRGGPYRWLRHPGYAGAVLFYLATPPALGVYWAFIPAVLTSAVVVVRTALEDALLVEQLPGYAAYASRTRYRLLPGVW